MAKLDDAADALDKGYITREEYAKIALDEKAITPEEYAEIVPPEQVAGLREAGRAAAAPFVSAAKATGRPAAAISEAVKPAIPGIERAARVVGAPVRAGLAAYELDTPEAISEATARYLAERQVPGAATLGAAAGGGLLAMREFEQAKAAAPGTIAAAVAEQKAREGSPYAVAAGIEAGLPFTLADIGTIMPQDARQAAEFAAAGGVLGGLSAIRKMGPTVEGIVDPIARRLAAYRQGRFERQMVRQPPPGVPPGAAPPPPARPAEAAVPPAPPFPGPEVPPAQPASIARRLQYPELPPEPPAPPQRLLGGPAAPRRLAYEPPIQGEGFQMLREQAPRRVFDPRTGQEITVFEPFQPPEGIRRATARRLGIPEAAPQRPARPPKRPPEAPPGAPPAPGATAPQKAPKPTKARVQELLGQKNLMRTVRDPVQANTAADLIKIPGLVDEAKKADFIRALAFEHQYRYKNTADYGPQHPETIALGEVLKKLGVTPRAPQAPEVAGKPAAPVVKEVPAAPPGAAIPSPAAVEAQPSRPSPVEARIASLEKQAGKPLHEMPQFEFEATFPKESIKTHDAAVDIFKAGKREYEAGLAKKEAAELRAQGITSTPVLDSFERRGLKLTPREEAQYGRELREYLAGSGRKVFKDTGVSLESHAQQLFSEGQLHGKDAPNTMDAAIHEIQTGKRFKPPGGLGEAGAIFPKGRPYKQAKLPKKQAPIVGIPSLKPDTPEVAAYKARIKEYAPPKTRIRQSFEKIFTDTVNKNNPILELRKKAGKAGAGKMDARFIVTRYQKTGGIAEQWINDVTSRLTPTGEVKITGEGLKPILSEWSKRFGPSTLKDLEAFMLAKHDIEVAKTGVRGVDPKNAPKVMQDLGAKYGTAMEDFANRAFAWQKRAYIQTLLDSGVINKKQADGMWDSYVPYDRVIEDLDPEGAARFASGFPLKGLTGSERAVYSPIEKMISQAYRMSEFADRNRVLQATVNLRNANPELATLITEVDGPQRGAIRVFFDGEPKYFKVPADVKDALENLQTPAFKWLARLIAFPANLQRAGVTASPAFSIGRNPIRDQFEAAINTRYGYVPGYDFVKGMFHAMGRSDLHREYIAAGGGTEALVAMDRVAAGLTRKAMKGGFRAEHLNPLRWLRAAAGAGETGTRLGVYARARQKVAPLEAAYEAAESTVNFGIKPGSKELRFWQQITAWMRPAVLGTARFARAQAENPVGTNLKALSYITLPSIASWYQLKDDPEYNELPSYRRMLFMNFRGGDKIWGVPMPHVYGLLYGSGPIAALNWAYKKDPRAVTEFAKQVYESLVPAMTPTGLNLAQELAANYSSFTGRPIAPRGKEHLLPEEQYGEYASETAKAIGRRLKISPAKVDYLIRGLGGGTATGAVSGTEYLLRKTGALPPAKLPPQPLLEGVLYQRRPIGSQSESVNRFYDILTKLEQEHATQTMREGVPGEPSAILDDMRFAKKSIDELRQENREMMDDRSMVPERRKELIDKNNAEITDIARQVVQAAQKLGN